ncbi:hypothetical protein CLOLEP_01078 [[Clostridium] leptum DSM 753]|uniref:Uncharacterized protein n=1 Tax=[Clostridium] leptum DSM 753 TaxID=428125 RepID=A7VR94_9FIRM|nr:hypothetical protein CLOLEP_01078 [[Clostridium] leptum DSM 753]
METPIFENKLYSAFRVEFPLGCDTMKLRQNIIKRRGRQ